MSEVGEPAGDLLVDVGGAERLPERRGSFGEGGGPIVATFAIMKDKREKGGEVAFEFPESSPLELRVACSTSDLRQVVAPNISRQTPTIGYIFPSFLVTE